MVTEVVDAVKEHFGELIISRGNAHDLLGMNIVMDIEKKTLL